MMCDSVLRERLSEGSVERVLFIFRIFTIKKFTILQENIILLLLKDQYKSKYQDKQANEQALRIVRIKNMEGIINKDIQLITLVERFPHLYDKKNANYKDRIAVDNAWLFISGELKISVADCTARWLSLRNRFSKERNKKIPSGAATQTEWQLMKYLTFLHPVVKKRRTFGNITIEEESNSLSEIQDFDTYEENSQSLTKNDDCTQYTDYEYLNESDICTDVLSTDDSLSNLEESLPISDILNKHALVKERSTTPNASTFKGIAIPRPSTPEKPTTHNTSTPNRFSLKRKSSIVEEQLGNAVDVFKSFVTKKNTVRAEDESLKYFCDSLYGDLKTLNKKDLISCKIDIMQVISKYTN